MTLLLELGDLELFDRVIGSAQEPPESELQMSAQAGGQVFQANRQTNSSNTDMNQSHQQLSYL